MYTALRWAGTHEIWPYQSRRFLMVLAVFWETVVKLAIHRVRLMLCGRVHLVDVHHQTFSIQHGISYGEFELCYGNVCSYDIFS